MLNEFHDPGRQRQHGGERIREAPASASAMSTRSIDGTDAAPRGTIDSTSCNDGAPSTLVSAGKGRVLEGTGRAVSLRAEVATGFAHRELAAHAVMADAQAAAEGRRAALLGARGHQLAAPFQVVPAGVGVNQL
ncbi:hypothetical protein AB0J72_57455 [Dactylosporangium sp. NPDC049742]|uniref:hypothetical protein n=1 Tax=Dactylosporangium sp. NPDC049742 TaxID=3154737 RepID=UPI0034476F5D